MKSIKKNTLLVISFFLGIILIGGYFYYQKFVKNYIVLPQGEAQPITVTRNNEQKDILETENVKHSVPLDDIFSGGVPKDGIPPIDNPYFVAADDVPVWLDDDAEGISFVQGETARFYPFLVLVRHEIVNDTIDDQPILVTYCPLCLTGVVFDPLVNGQRVEFGVSGKLWNSNLLMYNRGDDSQESLWSQITGEAIAGELTGATIPALDSDLVSFGAWKKAHAKDGQVLVGENGRVELNPYNPYSNDFFDIPRLFSVDHEDARLDENAFVLGITIDGKFKAYDVEAIRNVGEIKDTFAGKDIVVRFEQEQEAVRIYEVASDGGEQRISAVPSFWFSWVAVHPETELYK